DQPGDGLVDAGDRKRARRAHEQRATAEERARFLARLARLSPPDERVGILHELLDVRVAVDDRVGAEATARDLLEVEPGDPRALSVLADLLADDPRRLEELVVVLGTRAEAARTRGERGQHAEALERL